MNLYDEAIEELQGYIGEYGMDYYATNHFPKTIKALERAKKEHELFGLYEEKERLQNYHYIVTEKQSSLDKSKINKEFADEMKKYKELLKQIQSLKEELK
jgi:glutamate synthase domain-containing protein 2